MLASKVVKIDPKTLTHYKGSQSLADVNPVELKMVELNKHTQHACWKIELRDIHTAGG